MRKFSRYLLPLALILAFVCSSVSAQTTSGNAPICGSIAILDGVTVNTRVIVGPAATNTTIFINGVPTVTQINSTRIHLCNIHYRVNQTATAANFGLATGTGTNCATGLANFTPQWTGVVSSVNDFGENFTSSAGLVVPAGKDLCLRLSAAPTGAQLQISYGIW